MTAVSLDPRLQLQPPPPRARLWLAALTIGLPVALIAGLLILQQSQVSTTVLAYAMTAMALVFLIVDRAMRRHRIVLDGSALEVVTTFYRRRLAVDELRLQQARVIDLSERTEFKPALRSNGTSLPGFHSGWFRLRNRNRALVAIAGGPRVLWLPTTRGFDLLLQPQQPQALLQHLRRLAAVPARG